MNLIQRIDALLPQTQCGKCGHPGCMPYAEGIAQGESINKCPPGGSETIAGLAQLLHIPEIALDTDRGSAPAQVAFIREAECIGCTKCIQACPVDAIVGAAKLMHTVLIDECTGCDLCVAPCPVDCIDLLPLDGPAASITPHSIPGPTPIIGGLAHTAPQLQARALKRNHARQRFERRTARLQREHEQRLARTHRAPATAPVRPLATPEQTIAQDPAIKQARSAVSMSWAQLNKSLKAFGHPPIYEQAMRLCQLAEHVRLAEQALSQLEQTLRVQASPKPASKSTPADLKRAKVQLAMARASLSKAQASEATAEQLQALTGRVHSAEHALRALEQP